MKAILLCLVISTASLVAQSPAPTASPARDLRALLQDGLFEEEANRNLEKAAAAYESLLEGFDQQRQYAATALFRLAEVRAKQNRKDDAIALYQRVISEFRNDQLAKLSRERLATLGSAPPVEGAPAIADKEAQEVARLQDLVKNSPDLLNSPDKDQLTPLANAAKEGWLKAATFLIDHGADLAGRFGTPALHIAAIHGRKAMAELLLDRGAKVNGQDQSGDSALVAAITASRPEVAKVLLERGADPALKNRSNHTPLHVACGRGDMEMVKLLLSKTKELNVLSDYKPNFNSDPVGTPLMFAIYNSRGAVAKLLIEQGADVNIETPAGESALGLAVKSDDLDLATLLLEHRADARKPDLLVSSVSKQQTEMVRLLIKHGADVNAANQLQAHPLHLAAKSSLEIAKLLLEAGADPNLKDSVGYTPLLVAILNLPNTGESSQHRYPQPGAVALPSPRPPQPIVPRPGRERARVINPVSQERALLPPDPLEMMKLLVSKGAKINAQDKDGNSVIYYAAPGRLDVLEWLLANGANPELKNASGQSALEVAGMTRRVWLEQRVLFPKWVKDGGIVGANRFRALETDVPLTSYSPIAEFDSPPSVAEVVRKVFMSVPGQFPNFLPPDFDVLIFRADATGNFEQIFRSKENVAERSGKPTEFPSLQWKDVVVVLRDPALLGAGAGGAIADSFRSFGTDAPLERARQLTIELGDRKGQMRLLGDNLNWDPTNQILPEWNLSELATQIAAGEPRADLSALTVRRKVGDEVKEWKIDLRSQVPGETLRSLPARFADGDTISIPLLAPSDGNALTHRRTGIFRAAPGRLFGERIFRMTEPDNAPRTLGDLVAEAYANSPMIVPKPDLAKVKIHRLMNDQGEEETIHVDLVTNANQVTARSTEEEARKLDVPLQVGDIVEIPVADDPAEQWTGLSGQMRLFLKLALSRGVTVSTAKGQDETNVLLPVFLNFSADPMNKSVRWVPTRTPAQPFRAGAVVKATPNLIKVRIVSRGKSFDYTPESLRSINPWLVDGDVIEVERF